jgi:starch synthase (maltosyl-transferring)
MVKTDGRKRVIIEKIAPVIDNGAFPSKRIVGEEILISADIFADGHDEIRAAVLYKAQSESDWREVEMNRMVNDRWEAQFTIELLCDYDFKYRRQIRPIIS